jgi:PAS domain-containing protein
LLEGTAYRSDQMYRIAGREAGSIDPLPEPWLQLVHPEDVESVRNAWAETRTTGKDYQIQYRVLWPDGSVHWLESQAKCQRNSEGRATRLELTARGGLWDGNLRLPARRRRGENRH